jgi:hypothetical protein
MNRRLLSLVPMLGFDTPLEALTFIYDKIKPTEGDRAACISVLYVLSHAAVDAGKVECACWLREMGDALDDLNNGVVWPVLQPAKRKPLKPSYVYTRRAYVAAGVKALIKSGMSRKDAAEQAIRKVKIIRGTSIQTVLSWMDEFGKVRGMGNPGWFEFIRNGASKRQDRAALARHATVCFGRANRPDPSGISATA